MKQPLSQEQEEIVYHNDGEGACLVEASAGSGKTRVLTERVRYLLTEKKDKYFSVLCLTFTNKAADEMKERLKDVSKIKERAFIGTIHEFCLNNIISPRKHEIGLSEIPHIFENDLDRRKVLEGIFLSNSEFEEYYIGKTAEEQQSVISGALNFISNAKKQLIHLSEEVTEWADWTYKRVLLYKEYNQQLLSQNTIDFDDIILCAHRILSGNPQVSKLYRKIYQYILIDEAQDLNYAHYHLLKALCNDSFKNILMVGDSNQAIYGFAGANPEFMQKQFVKDFSADIKKIQHNYRSSKKVLELAGQVKQSHFPNKENFFEGCSEFHTFQNEAEEASWIVEKIKEWVLVKGIYAESGIKIPINFSDIAVIARNRYVFSTLIQKIEEDSDLAKHFHTKFGATRFQPESKLLKIFDLGLRVVSNSYNLLHFKQIYIELRLDFESNFNSSLEALSLLNIDEKLPVFKRKEMAFLYGMWNVLDKNPSLFDKALDDIKKFILENDTSYSEEERLQMFYEITEYKKNWRFFLQKTSALNRNLTSFRHFLALNSVSSSKSGVTLSTVHMVKGLEYEIVFLMGLNEGTFPYYLSMRSGDKAMVEEKNNLYVAITRSKKAIYLSYPQNKMMPWGKVKKQVPSQFLKEKFI
jgi:DNA helicase-2/ATP-dependent DNA helicase PcrA